MCGRLHSDTCESFPLVADDDSSSSCPAGCDYGAVQPASLARCGGGFTAGQCVACATENVADGKDAIASSEALCSGGVTADYALSDIINGTTCGASLATDAASSENTDDNNLRWVSESSTDTHNLVVDLAAPYLVVRADVISGTSCGGPLTTGDYSAEATLQPDAYLQLDAGSESSIAGVSIMGMAGSTAPMQRNRRRRPGCSASNLYRHCNRRYNCV